MAKQLEVSVGKLSFYRENRLGLGKYSSVFKGKFEDKKTVAIKRLLKDQSRVDSHLLLNGGGHPNILPYNCIEEADVEFIYLAIDLCAGNLEDYVSNQSRWPELGGAKQVCHQITLGLEHLHSLEIVHGDLKPSNILISFAKGTVGTQIKLSDFGLRHIPETSRKGYSVLSNQKARFQAASTFGWKPRDAKIDLPFDVFALACAICYALTKGRHPFGDTVEARVSNIEKNCIAVTPELLVEVVDEAAAVFKMLQNMLDAKSELRPTVPQLLTHPFFDRSSSTDKNRIWNFEEISAAKRIKLEMPEATTPSAINTLPVPVVRAEVPPKGRNPKQDAQNGVERLGHAYKCKVSNCHNHSCTQIKNLLKHMKSCKVAKDCNFKTECRQCSLILTLCLKHASECREPNCRFPFCWTIRSPLKSAPTGSNNTAAARKVNEGETVAPKSPEVPARSVQSQPPSALTEIIPENVNRIPPKAAVQSQESTSTKIIPETPTDSITAEGPRTGNESADTDVLTRQKNVVVPVSSHEETLGSQEVSDENKDFSQEDIFVPEPILCERDDQAAAGVELAASSRTPDQQKTTTEQSPTEAFRSQKQSTDPNEDSLSRAMDFAIECENRMEIPNSNLSLSPPSSLSPSGDRQENGCNSKSPAEKEKELFQLCSREGLFQPDMIQLRDLVMDMTVSINNKNIYGFTPLMLLCKRHRGDLLSCLKIFSERKDVDFKILDGCGDSALSILCRFYPHDNLIGCVRLLLKHGADVDRATTGPKHPLILLCHHFRGKTLIDIIRLLLRPMRNLDAARKAVRILRDEGRPRDAVILSKLIEHHKVDRPPTLNTKERELLQLCCAGSLNEEQVNRLRELALDKEVDANVIDEDGFSPLLWLVNYCHMDRMYQAIKSLLLRSSVDIEHKTNQGLDALLLICKGFRGSNLFYVIKLLLIHKIGVNSTCRDGKNAIHYLLADFTPNLFPIVHMLIDEGINVRATAADGTTLLIALSNRYHSHPDFIPVARILIGKGCDVNSKNKKGQSALTILCDQHKLVDYAAFADKLKLLLQLGADPKAKDITGRNSVDIIKQRYKKCPKVSPLKIILSYLPDSSP